MAAEGVAVAGGDYGRTIVPDALGHAMTEERKGLLDEVEALHQRRGQKKTPKRKGDLDLDKVWND